jgi:hypothetical protein
MERLRSTLALALLPILAACAPGSTVVTGPVADPLPMTDVQLLYRRPDCDFIEVARIEIPGNYFNRLRLIDALRAEAARLGADRLQIIDLETVGSSEYRGTARALRCR